MSMQTLVAVMALCVVCTGRSHGQVLSDSIAVETLAARHLTASHQGRALQLDSAFAMRGQAPGVPTARLRPAHRNRALADSISGRIGGGGPPDAARLILSEPDFRGDTAMVTVTISYDTGRPRGDFYETVLVTVIRSANRWRVARSVQLGIT